MKVVRVLRAVHHAVAYESRHGRAAEVAGWSNLLASLGLGLAANRLGAAPLAALLVAALAFVLLRVALVHRTSIGVAALLGTLAVAAVGGGLAWTFGHALEEVHPAAPQMAGVAGALLGALLPAWAYATVAQHRRNDVPDSLLGPASSKASG